MAALHDPAIVSHAKRMKGAGRDGNLPPMLPQTQSFAYDREGLPNGLVLPRAASPGATFQDKEMLTICALQGCQGEPPRQRGPVQHAHHPRPLAGDDR